MARGAEGKFDIAKRAYEQATQFGIPADDIFFDALALPISTGIEEDRAQCFGDDRRNSPDKDRAARRV
jgi:5-methyltetrahydrofolate--homocysteine methyltransferase